MSDHGTTITIRWKDGRDEVVTVPGAPRGAVCIQRPPTKAQRKAGKPGGVAKFEREPNGRVYVEVGDC
jgi:hypothetical protein